MDMVTQKLKALAWMRDDRRKEELLNLPHSGKTGIMCNAAGTDPGPWAVDGNIPDPRVRKSAPTKKISMNKTTVYAKILY